MTNDFCVSEMLAVYAGARFVIACRLHSAIFAIVSGTPALIVSVDSEKAEGVFETLGLGDFILGPGSDSSSITGRIRELVQNESETRSRLADASARARNTLDVVPTLLRAVARR